MQKTSIFIVDDHELFRFGVRMAIETRHPDIVVVGEAESGTEFFALLKTVSPDIVLLDIALPDMSGIDIARRLKTEHPQIKIISISAENAASTVEAMVDIGIEGFISKVNSNPDILVHAIRSVAQGFEYFGKDISNIISRIYVAKKKTTHITSEFSEQEKHIIECCHKGLPAKQIADQLNLSVRTVDWHKSNIFRKLNINSTLEMIRFAEQNGIIER